MKTTLLAILMIFSYLTTLGGIISASANDECKFMDEARQQSEASPYELAKTNVENDKIVFFSVGAGFAGVMPDFKNNEEFMCVDSSYKVEMIWVGGDVISCEGQSELGEKVIDWAEKYNKELKKLLIKSGEYKCRM
jgi:hypothetical protein